MATQSTPLQTRVFSDFDVDFTAHPITGDLTRKTGVNAVVQSVLSLVQTNHYERPFHPEIGSNIRKLLFELSDSVTANLIAEEIKHVLSNFEPRVNVTEVYVQSDAEGLGYNVTIVFTLIGVAAPISITTFLERLR